jgi:hypothetical protein
MKWTKADGTQNPDWWEIDGKKRSADEEVQTAGEDNEDDSELVSAHEDVLCLFGLALIQSATSGYHPPTD